jgi:hypothetical protein
MTVDENWHSRSYWQRLRDASALEKDISAVRALMVPKALKAKALNAWNHMTVFNNI